MAAEHAPEIEQLVRTLLDAYRSGDVETLSRFTSSDSAAMLVGSDATEVARGHDAIVAMLGWDVERRAADAPSWAVEEIEAYREGDVGWATILGPYPIGDSKTIPARGSAVFHRQDGEWKIVNWVFSFAVPNEALRPGSAVAAELAVARV